MEASQEELLKIKIPDYQISDPASSKRQVLYRVETANKKDEITSVLRSYKDFLKIRKLLIYRWPGIYIPFISSKVKQSIVDKEFIEKRRELLEDFLIRVSVVPYLLSSKEFQTFLLCEEDINENLKPFETDSIENIVTKYQKVFEELSGVCDFNYD